MIYPSNTYQNAIHGVMGRILHYWNKKTKTWEEIPRPDPVHLAKTFAYELREFASYSYPLPRMSLDAYLATVSGKRRKRYERAKPQAELGRDWGFPNQFVKLEAANASKPGPHVPRVITDPGPTYNMLLGTFIKPIEHHVFRMFANLEVYPPIMKGINSAATAELFHLKWSRFADPIAIGGDGSRFDAHTSPEIQSVLEHQVYYNFYPGDPVLEKLLKSSLKRKVVFRTVDGILRYTLQSRGSGDHNTGVGNTIISYTCLRTWRRMCGVDFEISVNGDDWTVIMERVDEWKFRNGCVDYYLSLGYRMVLEDTVDIFEKIDFCQTHPVKTENGHLMVRDFNLARVKDSNTFRVRSREE